MDLKNEKFGTIAVALGILKEDAVETLAKNAQTVGMRMGEYLLESKEITEDQLLDVLEKQGNQRLSLNQSHLSIELVKKFALKDLLKDGFAPIKIDNGVVTIVCNDPYNQDIITKAKECTNSKRVNIMIDSKDNIKRQVTEFFRVNNEYLSSTDNELIQFKSSPEPFLAELFLSAKNRGASDIHFDPRIDGSVAVYFRILGDRQLVADLKADAADKVTRTVKVKAKLNGEKKGASDGQIKHESQKDNLVLNLRASFTPVITSTGDSYKIVLRLLGNEKDIIALTKVGFIEEDLKVIKNCARQKEGLGLIVGATGSGKSTTNYSILDFVNTPEINCVSIEDPVEIWIEGINQYKISQKPTNEDATVQGMLMQDALRYVLRQDPDIINIGEIRDDESAQTALSAAETGHYVLSTLHTIEAAGAIPRLQDMGVNMLKLANTLKYVVAQKLVKKLCPHCKVELTEGDYYDAAVEKLGKEHKFYTKGNGCPECKGLGFEGRTIVYEMLAVNNRIRDYIYEGNYKAIRNSLKRTFKDVILHKLPDLYIFDLEFFLFNNDENEEL